MAKVLGLSMMNNFSTKKGRKPLVTMTQEQVDHFLNKAKELENLWYHIWLMALHTGMRSSELMNLKWDEINFEKNIIHVRIRGYNDRYVPMTDSVKHNLENLKKNASSDYVLPDFKRWRNRASVELRRFLKSIGMEEVKFYALRATWGLMLLNRGAPMETVMLMGGWHSQMMFVRYINLAKLDSRLPKDLFNF